MPTFNKENISDLKSTCEKVISLLEENVDGAFMTIQLMLLGDRIKDLQNNPIVKNSGILKQD